MSAATYETLEQRLSTAMGSTPGSQSSLMARVAQILEPSQRELFFTSLAVFVEGQEDVAFVSTQLGLSHELAQFRALGCHFVIAGGKTNLSRLVGIAQELRIPHFLIFDADGDDATGDKAEKQRRDNLCLMRLSLLAGDDAFPQNIIWGENVVVWPTNMQRAVRANVGDIKWADAQQSAREEYDLKEGVRAKNSMLIAYTLEMLATQGVQSSVLVKLCGSILRYAEKVRLS